MVDLEHFDFLTSLYKSQVLLEMSSKVSVYRVVVLFIFLCPIFFSFGLGL